MERKARKTTPSLKEEESPLRGIFCLKKRQDMKRFEETEDCFILDFFFFFLMNGLIKLKQKKFTNERMR
ncbi:hypothetical protein V5N11_027133 [Cardamine amara subsp. amara]|uniref:Uncharacterized protein n=1 Tax=Cardamine amara subsp. amara TaxID=228776 RepID=A0ABD1AY25_CARAN